MNLTKLLENRKTENIGSIDLLSEKLGVYNFFDKEDFSDVVLFIDRGNDEVYKNYFKTHQNVIQEKMTKARKTFISSFQLEKIETVNYDVFVPFVSVDEVFDLVKKRQNFNQNFLDFLDYQGEIRTGIILVDKGEMLFIEMLSLEDFQSFIEEYCIVLYENSWVFLGASIACSYNLDKSDENDKSNGKRSRILEELIFEEPEEITYAEAGLNEENLERIINIQNQVKEIVRSGQFFVIAPIIEKILQRELISTAQPCPITITNDFNLLIRDYRVEIEMSHLTKSIYLLFLNEKEGIELQNLHLYKEKLLNIYQQISYKNSIDEIKKSVEAVVDVSTRQIYIHLSRIKASFCRKIHPNLAEWYYIKGDKGKERSIRLDRNLVIWEEK